MRVPASIQHGVLKEWDVLTFDILNVQKECKEIQKQRYRTLEKAQRYFVVKKLACAMKKRLTRNDE